MRTRNRKWVYCWFLFIMEITSGGIFKTEMSPLGVDIRISTHSKQGGRKYMEDVVCGNVIEDFKGENGKEPYAFFAVFDGHGGVEAAAFAKKHLHDEVVKNKGFWTDDDEQVTKAIKDGFVSTHKLMWKALPTWPKTVSGYSSTAGTTASVVFIKNMKIYVAHVGDSAVVLGTHMKASPFELARLTAQCVTVDHKPDDPQERERIESKGGKVIAKAGVQRVVWQRPRASHHGPVRRSTLIDNIPFLAVARALGDLWSYNSQQDEFVVSPEPDTAVYKLDLCKHRYIVLASDGLWNMVQSQEAINMVHTNPHQPAEYLVEVALSRWFRRNMRADNTSVIVVALRSPGSSPSPPTGFSDPFLCSSEDEEDSFILPFTPQPKPIGLSRVIPPIANGFTPTKAIHRQPVFPTNSAPAKMHSTESKIWKSVKHSRTPKRRNGVLKASSNKGSSDSPCAGPAAKKRRLSSESEDHTAAACPPMDAPLPAGPETSSPRGATSAKSPLKVEGVGSRVDSPSVGHISPVWPNSLDSDYQMEASASQDLLHPAASKDAPSEIAKGSETRSGSSKKLRQQRLSSKHPQHSVHKLRLKTLAGHRRTRRALLNHRTRVKTHHPRTT